MTVVAFCEREGVSTASFYNWRRRLDDQDRSREPDRPAFVPVTVAVRPSPWIEILLPTDVTIRVPDGADRQTILDVLSACGGISP
jgi:hypothetical protein